MNECAKPPLPDANSRAIKIEMRPLVQPRLISKGELQEKYSRLVDGKLRSLEKALRVRSKDTLDDQQIASYIFDGAKSKIKRSSSFLSISPSIDCESEAPYAKSVVNSNSTVENDIATLNKLRFVRFLEREIISDEYGSTICVVECEQNDGGLRLGAK
eukprot:TRINITY_DN4024_c0_g1_i4.p1 TRINITY_DN4024_c0_g1~~TRINITY_DN4024_c0_g1_i4.p1  ORF type:complete len:158 (+),score=15.33 TRINITY_DN4024_c0_g1_i4:427-900(+)